MRKYITIILFPLLLIGCKVNKEAASLYDHSDVRQESSYSRKSDVNIKDSVVIRDSVVMHPDGSKSSFKSKEKYRTKTEKEITKILVKTKQTVTIIKKILTTKHVYVHDYFWWSSLVLHLLLFIIILNKLYKKFKP